MKSRSYLLIRRGLLLLLTILVGVSPVRAEEIVLSVGNWPPHIDGAATHQGLLSGIVVAAFERAGITATLAFRPWKRVEVEIDEQQRLSFGWIWTEARSQKWYYSEAIFKGSTVFAVRKDRPITWQRLEDLEPFVIGITRGYSYGDAFDQFKRHLNIQAANSDEANLRKLLHRRIDLFPVDSVVGSRLLRTRFTAEERDVIHLMTESPLTSQRTYLVCAKTYDRCLDYLQKFNQGLALITQDGTKQRLLEQP